MVHVPVKTARTARYGRAVTGLEAALTAVRVNATEGRFVARPHRGNP